MLDATRTVIAELDSVFAMHPAHHRTPVVHWAAVLPRPPSTAHGPARQIAGYADVGHSQVRVLAICAAHAGKSKAGFPQQTGAKGVGKVNLGIPVSHDVQRAQRRPRRLLLLVERVV